MSVWLTLSYSSRHGQDVFINKSEQCIGDKWPIKDSWIWHLVHVYLLTKLLITTIVTTTVVITANATGKCTNKGSERREKLTPFEAGGVQHPLPCIWISPKTLKMASKHSWTFLCQYDLSVFRRGWCWTIPPQIGLTKYEICTFILYLSAEDNICSSF